MTIEYANPTDKTNGYGSARSADKLAEQLREARDWLIRSCRIDDQEQADDANAVLEAYEREVE